MTRSVKKAAWCAVAIALVGGCADRTSQDSASADNASTYAGPASSAAPGGETTAPPATTSSATAPHCASATADTLKSATQLNYGEQPFTVDSIRCSGDWAKALIPARPSHQQQGAIVLFHYIGNGWSAVQFGSGFDCADEGVPASTAAELGC